MSKDIDWSKYPNFTPVEMRCRHTGLDGITDEFMERLQRLRAAWGKPMSITSGYRHSTHPIEAKKAKPGAHSTGKACDIHVQGADALRLVALAIEHGFTRIGVNQIGNASGRFVHLDICTEADGFPSPCLWSY